MLINDKYEVKRLTSSLVLDFIEVFKKSFNSKLNLKEFYKAFGKEDEYLGYLAYDNNIPVGFFGAIVFNFSYNGTIVKSCQGTATGVIPEYRKDDLVLSRYLAKATFELAKEYNIKFLFGFPNNALYARRVLNHTDLGEMKKISLKIHTFPLAKVACKLFFLKDIYRKFFLIFVSSLINKNYNNLKIKDKIDNTFYIQRSPEYMKYKSELGSFVLKIKNKNVWLNIDYRIKIGDLEDMSSIELENVLKKIKSIAFWTGITEIIFYVDKTSEWNNLFEKTKVTVSDSLHLMYVPFDDDYKLNYASLTLGDFDTF